VTSYHHELGSRTNQLNATVLKDTSSSLQKPQALQRYINL